MEGKQSEFLDDFHVKLFMSSLSDMQLRIYLL